MPFLATALNGLGLILLSHAVYSTHEHTALHPQTSTPTDITLELLASILLLSTGIVLGSGDLKPIKWASWAGKIEKEGRKSEGRWTREGEEINGEGDPFQGLVEGGRRGFWDVRGKRKEFADWVREGSKQS